MRTALTTLACILLAACEPQASSGLQDPLSFAHPGQFESRHLALDLDVDFEARALCGSATLDMVRLDAHAEAIVLDTRNLHVAAASVAAGGAPARTAAFRLRDPDPLLGRALEIEAADGGKPGAALRVRIEYCTDENSTALQWLPAELTAGGTHPVLFSQSQSIHARSWIPLQDTPSVRITFEATIRTPPELLALMSADNDPRTPRDGEYRFEMPQPIPSYLLAIAVGDLHFEAIGERTGVYAERELLAAAAWEFADTQAMLETTEEIYGPYRWGRYDLLILPPSFPYGGMENPRLSFITPTVLAGDRSQVSLIAHELAHSWSGNLVSNATWRDVWLNEGVTSYLDARLIEALYGVERADEERVLSYRDLLRQLDTLPPSLQVIAPQREVRDPDASNPVAYAKGQLFLQHLEALFGRDNFDRFLAGYFEHFRWQSITTEQFLDYLDRHLLSAYPGKLSRGQASEWLYEPGIPADATIPHSPTLQRASNLAMAWAKGEAPVSGLRAIDMSPMATVHLVQSLPDALDADQLAELDATLGLSTSGNALINRAWFTQVAKRRHQPAYGAMQRYLEASGRIYLVEPVYRALVNNGVDGGLALEIFAAARHRYHPLTLASISRLLSEGDR